MIGNNMTRTAKRSKPSANFRAASADSVTGKCFIAYRVGADRVAPFMNRDTAIAAAKSGAKTEHRFIFEDKELFKNIKTIWPI
jgi:hypothetical protein